MVFASLALSACAAPPDRSAHATALNTALESTGLPDLATDRVVHSREGWHALYESGDIPQLHLVHLVESVEVLQREVQMLEPVVWFRFEDGFWRGHVASGEDSLPGKLTDALRTQLDDTRKIYAYRHVPIALAATMDSAVVVTTVDSVRRAIARDVRRWRSVGFFSARDAP